LLFIKVLNFQQGAEQSKGKEERVPHVVDSQSWVVPDLLNLVLFEESLAELDVKALGQSCKVQAMSRDGSVDREHCLLPARRVGHEKGETLQVALESVSAETLVGLEWNTCSENEN
jgi:hypothetical protein